MDSGEKRVPGERLAIAFAATFPLALTWVYFVQLGGAGGPSWLAAGYAVGKLIQFPFPLAYALLFDRASLRGLRLANRGLGWGIAFALAVDVAFAALYFGVLRDGPLLAETGPQILEKLRQFRADAPLPYFAFGAFVCLLHSGLEEYYWRWFVFGRMTRVVDWRWAAALSGVAFMAHHVVILGVYFPGRFWTMAAPLALCVAVGGVVWAWLFRRSDSLLAPWLSHALIDAGIFLVGYDLASRLW